MSCRVLAMVGQYGVFWAVRVLRWQAWRTLKT
jgi:hypothetical protein